ncbi:MAG: transposase, partial [Micrococcales bacterium]
PFAVTDIPDPPRRRMNLSNATGEAQRTLAATTRPVGSSRISTSTSSRLKKSLSKAFTNHKPNAGVLVHTDQGFQYQHAKWRNLIRDHEAVQSMSRKANCYDNAVMENFFGHLKTEMFHGEVFNTVDSLVSEINQYITWYNNERVQERLKGMTPMQYRSHALQLKPA